MNEGQRSAQVFARRSNTIARVTLAGGLALVVAGILVAAVIVRSPWATAVGVPLPQPVPFSHQHHVRDDMIDKKSQTRCPRGSATGATRCWSRSSRIATAFPTTRC